MIALLTDFGDSEYVGAMKGVIYSIKANAVIADISHNIRAFDIRHAAYALYSVYRYFPEKTVFTVVVDPGVGTKRKGVILEGNSQFFVGPDNGVFSLIKADQCYEIDADEGGSATFHGRDFFAPVAAKIDSGITPAELGVKTPGYKRIMEQPVDSSENLLGQVYCIDAFGNIITSITNRHVVQRGLEVGEYLNLKIAGQRVRLRFVKTYGDADKGELAALINSAGHLEISMREGNASETLKIFGGEAVEVSK